MYEEVEFFSVQSFGVQIRCSVLFDVQYLSAMGHWAFGHSVSGPYSQSFGVPSFGVQSFGVQSFGVPSFGVQ
jgi:hypothetical protein